MNGLQKFVKKVFNITIDEDNAPSNTVLWKRRSQNKKDLTFPDTVNTKLTKAIYYNRDPMTKLGAHFARNIINIPLGFMGFPHFYTTKKVQKFWNDIFTYYNDKAIKFKQDIQRTSSRDGTCWIYPRFDSITGFVVWDFLPQASKFYFNIDTQIMTAVEFEENLTIEDSRGSTRTITQTTRYTATDIIILRDGVQTVKRNTAGILPVNFINNGEPEEPEGNSDLEVVYPRILLYSQLDYKKCRVLINHEPKWVQYVSDLEKWRLNNGITTAEELDSFDIEGTDFVLNLYDKEKTEYLIPTEIIDAYEKALKTNFRNMVEGSEIPEIAWGLKTEGNHASAEEQIAVFIAYVNMKRNGLKSSYEILINTTFELMAQAYFKRFNFEIEQTWTDLDMLSKVEKSTLFNNYATGIQKLRKAGVLGKEGTHKILRGVLGDEVIDEFNAYISDIEAEETQPEPEEPHDQEEEGAD